VPSHGWLASLQAPGYPRLWASGWLWNVARWIAFFLSSYLINKLTSAPFLVQLTGAAFYAPVLLGGAVGGVISDRFDRRRSLMAQQALLIPVAVLMAILALSGHLTFWMLYPFMVLVGTGWMVDLTSRRALVFDMVGAEGITNAMALESMSMTGGAMLGNLAAGAIIRLAGGGPTFVAMAILHVGVWVCLIGLPAVQRRHVPAGSSSVLADLAAGLRYVSGQRLLLSVLGVTMLVNFFYYPYQPLVPVFAAALHVSAVWAGVLAASAGFGALAAAICIAAGRRPRRGIAYVGGSSLAMFGVLVFALSRWYPLSLMGLALAGAGQAGYSSMQGAIVLSNASDEMRGRAIGVISMGIGVLPVSLPIVGLVAQWTGAAPALAGTAVIGMVLLGLWTVRRRNLLDLA
jgi:MFS family permease